MTVPNIFSKATGTVVTKFHIEPAWAEGTKLCSKSPGHMTNMADMPVHGKTPKKISGTSGPVALEFDM